MNDENSQQQTAPATFSQLVQSRKDWIRAVLEPWCRQASLRDLRLAESEWIDIAGKVDANATLWTWAWSRFPELVHENLPGLDETGEIEITLTDGTTHRGYPDARSAGPGEVLLISSSPQSGPRESGPFAIDQIQAARRIGDS